MNKALSILGVVLASAALLLALMNRAGPSHPTPVETTGDSTSTLAAQVEKLQQDQQALKESNRELLAKVAQLERGSGSSVAGPAELARLRQRLDELDAKQAQVTQLTRDIDKYGVIAGMEKELVNAYSTLLDTNQTLAARIKQVGTLKRNGHFDKRAVGTMTDLYRQSNDFNEKGAVLSALSGSVTPELRDQILSDLNQEIQGGNKSGRFRYHAIEALEPMLPDPAVQQWLNHLAQNDPEPKIASRAGQPLGLAPARSPAK